MSVQDQMNDLSSANSAKNYEKVREILSKNPELINHRSEKNISEFWHAMLRGYEEIVEIFLEFGADPDEKYKGISFIQHAAKCNFSFNYCKVLDILIRHGADVRVPVEINENKVARSLRKAISQGCVQFVEYLFQNGVDLKHINSNEKPLEVWVFDCKNHSKLKNMLLLLLKYGLNTEFRSNFLNENLLHCYIRKKIDYQYTGDLDEDNDFETVEIAEILLNVGIPVNELDKLEYSPLHLAIELKDFNLVSYLIKRGADVNAGCNGISPLILTVETHEVDLVELLLSNGAEVNAKIYDGKTALHIACFIFLNDAIKLLIQKGADINVEDNDGKTPFSQLFIEDKPDFICLKIMIEEISKLYSQNLPVSKKDLDLIQSNPNYQEYFEFCLAQLSEMTEIIFYPPYSYYSVLKMSKNIKKLAKLTKNAEFVEKFESNLPKDVMYGDDLRMIFYEATQLRDQTLTVNTRLRTVLGDILPAVVMRKLVDNLSVEDLPLDK